MGPTPSILYSSLDIPSTDLAWTTWSRRGKPSSCSPTCSAWSGSSTAQSSPSSWVRPLWNNSWWINISAVKTNYRNVIYHNFSHGFHVANSVYSILKVKHPQLKQSVHDRVLDAWLGLVWWGVIWSCRPPLASSPPWSPWPCLWGQSATTWTTGAGHTCKM